MAQRKTDKGGRPPLPADQVRKHRIMVNLSVQELDQLEAAAGHEPLGAFVRRVLLRYLARRRK